MRLGCDKRCPKVREQLRKARVQAGEEPDTEDSSSSGSSTGENTKNGFPKRGRQSSRHPSGAGSPSKTPGSLQRSEDTLAHRSPLRSQRRSKDSQKSRGRPSGRLEPGSSADASRRLDSKLEVTRRSQEGEPTAREHQSGQKKKTASPKSPRNGRFDSTEHKPGTSGWNDAVQRTPDYAAGLKRGASAKGRRKVLEDHDEERAGPSRKSPSRKEEEQRDTEASDERLPKWRSGAAGRCGPQCRARDQRTRRLESEKQRREEDDYLAYKNLPYFEDLCNCCYECLTNQLWKDRFFKSTVASVAVFALGLKLCWDLDGWTIPNPL